MIIGRVYGSVVSTHKLESLVGYKFMLVQCIENGELVNKYLTAVDGVGAGIGEDVSSPRVRVQERHLTMTMFLLMLL